MKTIWLVIGLVMITGASDAKTLGDLNDLISSNSLVVDTMTLEDATVNLGDIV